ncbi:MAG: HAD-IIB family hydrolase [Acidobacteria bacterium]|nr:HAD-IIB family hydrolase [Acidobacteriota bacterium]
MQVAPVPPVARPLLVFTDLDGTLLDHDTYSWKPAAAALEELRRRGVPVVLNSSKTKAEQLCLRREMENSHPFIVENGAAVYVPEGYFPGLGDRLEPGKLEREGDFLIRRFGAPRSKALELLAELRQEGYQFEGFHDWTPEQLSEVASLPRERAARALERCCSEPVLWRGDSASLHYLQERADAAGLRLVQGGRFLHLMGRFDKAEALGWLRELYEADGRPRCTVALGDSPNDAAMLDAADVAVVIRSRRSNSIQPDGPERVIRTAQPGPKGWQEAMEQVLGGYGCREPAGRGETE